MHLTMIRPNLMDRRSSDALEPLAFAILKALTPPEVEVAFFDDRLERVPLDPSTDLVALTVETYTARRAYGIADAYRASGVPVVLGGYHPTFLPDEALAHADAVVTGDAEGVWERLLDDARAGTLQPRYAQTGAEGADLSGLAFDRSIFRGKRYPRILAVQYSRGCRFACDFCSIHAFYGTGVRQRPPAEVAAEIAASGRKLVLIVDDNVFVDRERALALFEALLPLGIRWGCQVSIDIAFDDELLELMARSGCVAALVGFESLDRDNLKQMRKLWNLTRGRYPEAIRRFRERGIMLYGSFVFGYDHDTLESFEATARFALEARFAIVNFSVLTPTPGSRLYDRLEAEGRLLFDAWWLDPRYRYGMATYRPTGMTPEALTRGALEARRRFFGARSILSRAFDRRANARTPANLGLYLTMNLVSRRELSGKLGRPLGAP